MLRRQLPKRLEVLLFRGDAPPRSEDGLEEDQCGVTLVFSQDPLGRADIVEWNANHACLLLRKDPRTLAPGEGGVDGRVELGVVPVPPSGYLHDCSPPHVCPRQPDEVHRRLSPRVAEPHHLCTRNRPLDLLGKLD